DLFVAGSTFDFHVSAGARTCSLSLHDALPISTPPRRWAAKESRDSESGSTHWASSTTQTRGRPRASAVTRARTATDSASRSSSRSEEHTSELQSREKLVCRLLLEKKIPCPC